MQDNCRKVVEISRTIEENGKVVKLHVPLGHLIVQSQVQLEKLQKKHATERMFLFIYIYIRADHRNLLVNSGPLGLLILI